MQTMMPESLAEIYPRCCSIMESTALQGLLADTDGESGPEKFSGTLAAILPPSSPHAYLADLARLEWAAHLAAKAPQIARDGIPGLIVNPTLSLLEVAWRDLPGLFNGADPGGRCLRQEQDHILIWPEPAAGTVRVRQATDRDLLALKIAVEELDPRQIARCEDITLARLEDTIEQAVEAGILLKPQSLLTRGGGAEMIDPGLAPFQTTPVFTLQWHITQACDLSCRHCYDRSGRSPVSLEAGLAVLDDLYDFCRRRHVRGQVSFTGGNPLLHPRFSELYRAAAERGLMTAVLGNPAAPEVLAEICAICRPEFYQVSLEGLAEHNDYIRGPGHFKRVLAFLAELRAADIYSMVMTLTRDNLDQVIPLADVLRDKTDLFTFNRLSMVGEGASLQTPAREEYAAFLEDYLKAAAENPVMGRKDNLINIVLERQGREPFGGCAGYGCGAAFNFVSLLADGEVHACRKFPSPIGNLARQRLADIYDSQAAAAYRRGPAACHDCRLWQVCRGCPAVTFSYGLDVFTERDPCCFIR
jgi:selenobiotic family peptide radical SAM maturase